jgi:hypothetical protein
MAVGKREGTPVFKAAAGPACFATAEAGLLFGQADRTDLAVGNGCITES